LVQLVVAADQKFVGALASKVLFHFGVGEYSDPVELERICIIFNVRFMEALQYHRHRAKLAIEIHLSASGRFFSHLIFRDNRHSLHAQPEKLRRLLRVLDQDHIMMVLCDKPPPECDFGGRDEDLAIEGGRDLALVLQDGEAVGVLLRGEVEGVEGRGFAKEIPHEDIIEN
jgi:hypothetical protein